MLYRSWRAGAVRYEALRDRSFRALAVCMVEGGPEYEVAVKGTAAPCKYSLDRTELDFGDIPFTEVGESELYLSNKGQVPAGASKRGPKAWRNGGERVENHGKTSKNQRKASKNVGNGTETRPRRASTSTSAASPVPSWWTWCLAAAFSNRKSGLRCLVLHGFAMSMSPSRLFPSPPPTDPNKGHVVYTNILNSRICHKQHMIIYEK